MYNQLFTDVWKMDRCIEASWLASTVLNIYLVWAALAVVSFLVLRRSRFLDRWISRLLKKQSKQLVLVASQSLLFGLSVLVATFLVLPVMFAFFVLAIIFGFLIFNCSYGPLWARVQPAHAMHATLKQTRLDGGPTPRSIDEFKQLNPGAFEKFEGKAEVSYEYIEERNGYHFRVRPSKYVVADFSDENDYVLYRTESLISPSFFRESPLLK